MVRGCRIYIGNLSSRVREREIEDDFSRYGRIRDISLKSGFGFVEFERPDDADYAIRKMHGVNLDGQRISCELAKELGDRRGPRGGGYGGGNGGGGGRGGHAGGSTGFRLTAENLSHETSWQDLKDFARTGGKVLYTDVRSERGEKIGVIEYETKDDMLDALDRLDGRELQGSRIRLFKESGGGGGGGRGRDDDRKPRERSRSRERDTRRRSRSKSRSRDRSPPPRKGRSLSASPDVRREPAAERSRSPERNDDRNDNDRDEDRGRGSRSP